MGLPPCFHLADEVFPRVRAELAHRLRTDGWSQAETAKALGVTQAMVSRYVNAPAPKLDDLARRLADDAHHELLQGTPPSGSAWCQALAPTEADGGALADLLAAERLLIGSPPLRLAPQVGLNLARGRPDATTTDHVLAFPGRLVEAGERLVRPVPPAWGGSGHLARGLLELRKRNPHLHAIANVRGGPDVRAAAAKLGPVTDLERKPTKDTVPRDVEAPYLAAARKTPETTAPFLFLHDQGGFGIEPCLYVAARDAVAAAQTILDLDQLVTR